MEEEVKLSKTQLNRFIKQVIKDDTYWDQMHGYELKKRIGIYQRYESKNEGKQMDAFLSMLSCLRLCFLVCLKEKVGNKWTMPVINHPDGEIILLFTSRDEAKDESAKSYRRDEISVADLIDSVNFSEGASIIINHESDNLRLPIAQIKNIFKTFDEIVKIVDDKMIKGIRASALNEITFEHFFCRDIYCELKDGSIYKGQVRDYKKESDVGSYLIVYINGEGEVPIYKKNVKFIKDITCMDE